jgi:hypothetical protein
MHDLVVRDLEQARNRTLGLTDLDDPTLVMMLPPAVDALCDAFKHPRCYCGKARPCR